MDTVYAVFNLVNLFLQNDTEPAWLRYQTSVLLYQRLLIDDQDYKYTTKVFNKLPKVRLSVCIKLLSMLSRLLY